MPDPRYNDISCKLRRIANDLESQARSHRHLADQLDHVMQTPPRASGIPPHVEALDAAALQLIHLPAAEIRRQAPIVARASGQQVLPVAIRAQQMRRAEKDRQRRAQTIKLLSALSGGATLLDATEALGISEATGRRLRDAWQKDGCR